MNDDYGDLHLLDGSPCVNRGDNTSPGISPFDIDAESRFQHCRIDIGADESPFYNDCNSNGTADWCELFLAGGENLLLNPGAESGNVDGWVATQGYSTRSGDPDPYEGSYYFYAGAGPAHTLEQTIDLIELGFSAATLDSGALTAHVGGYQHSWWQQADQGQISVEFQDGSGIALETFIGPVLAVTEWTLVEDERALPIGTRFIRFLFAATRQAGTSNDAYLDGTFVSLTDTNFTDCNANSVPDDCDVDPSDPDGNGWVSPDANGNGVPDECEGATTWYVDDNAVGANDGTSWTDAFTDLQDALAVAQSLDQVWVAEGTYTPAGPGGDRTATFTLLNGVVLYGGFDGTETSAQERAGLFEQTILSGDLNSDDAGWSNRADNSFNVLVGSLTDNTAILDGFTVTGGQADGVEEQERHGGGLYLDHGDSNFGLIDHANGSELDVAYATVQDGVLYLLLAGNLESNFNNLDIFLDTTPGEGQNRLRGDNPNVNGDALNRMGDDGSGNGLTFDAGFAPDHYLTLECGDTPFALFVHYSEVLTAGGGSTAYLGKTTAGSDGVLTDGNNLINVRATIDNSNIAGVTGGTGPDLGLGVITGIEIAVPLDAIGNPTDVRICAFVNGVGNDWISNQVLGPIGTGDNFGEPRDVDFVAVAGAQFFWVLFTDCNSNDIPDVEDLANCDGSAWCDDCNSNGVLDECDVDPNDPDGNGQVSEDLNGNNIPDECEVAAIWYVNDDAAGDNDGTSWADAFTDLQDALAIALPSHNIWVAAGTYTPAGSGGDRGAAFTLASGVSLLGGFDGTETTLAECAGLFDQTVLSGDLNGDDGSTGNGENSYHVITAGNIAQTTVLDGFTITAGNADGSDPDDDGGALHVTASDLTVGNCTFDGSRATDHGGAVFAGSGGTLQFSDCVFEANDASGGGGMWIDGVATSVESCSFTGNTAEFGAGLDIVGDQAVAVSGCSFTGNLANSSGGGLLVSADAPVDVLNCSFERNEAYPGTAYGGGGLLIFAGDLAVVNSVFSANTGQPYGGAIWAQGTSTTLAVVNCTVGGNTSDSGGGLGTWNLAAEAVVTNCVIWGNQDSGGMDESAQVFGTTAVTYSCIQGLDALAGNGNVGDDPLFVRAPYPDLDDSGDLRLSRGSPGIDMGTNTTNPPLPATDLDGDPRILNGTVDMGAYEGEQQALFVEPGILAIPEGGTNTFTVALACDPQDTVEVTVAPESGDPDLFVALGGTLWFDSQNYSTPQTVTLGADEDTDYLEGTATFAISAGGISANRVITQENENDAAPVPGFLLVGGVYSNSVVWKNEDSGLVSEFVPGQGSMASPYDLTYGPDGHLYVIGGYTDSIVRYDGQTGEWLDVFVSMNEGGLSGSRGLTFGADGDLYVSSMLTGEILRFDGQTGAFLDVFVAAGVGGLSYPHHLIFGVDGNLYVCSVSDEILRYDGPTGAFLDEALTSIDLPWGIVLGPDDNLYVCAANTDEVIQLGGGVFVSAGSGGLYDPKGLSFDGNGNLLVASRRTAQILQYDGSDGSFIAAFAGGGSGGVIRPRGITYGPDANLYVSSDITDEVLRYDGYTGAFVDDFVAPESGGLSQPIGLTVGPDGHWYVADIDNDNVLRFDGTNGSFIDEFVVAGSGGLISPSGVIFGPHGNLFVSDFYGNNVLRYYGPTGGFVDEFIPAGSTGLDGPQRMVWMPDFVQPGDFDDDGDVDLDDFADWDDCMTGPEAGPYGEGCRAFDFDHDGDVDLADFAALQRAFGQP